MEMLSWRAAFLVLLLIVSGFAMAPMVEETAMEEPPMDDMDDMPQEHENETEDEITMASHPWMTCHSSTKVKRRN